MIRHLPKVIFALAGIALPANAGTLILAKNNQPNATIILQANAPKPMQQAARDLQHYLQKMSGVQLPLKTDGNDVPGITLNIGKTATAQESDFPHNMAQPETYAITQRGDDVYFEGNYPTPTAFAVYSFLQDQLGVRWFAPGDDWEYVPQNRRGKSTFTVDVKDVVSVPGTSPRVWSGHYWNANWNTWNLRNKEVQSEKVLRRNFQNNMYRIFPPSKYAKTHPEYYPLVNGKRWIPSSDKDRNWWPCIGNPDVQRITAEYIHQWFKDHPDEDSFSLGMDDIAIMCDDPLCLAMDAHADDDAHRNFSSRYYKFINIVAKQVQKTDPGKYIGTLIYSIVKQPPVDVPKMEDNVFGYIADGSVAQWYQAGKKQEWMNLTLAWHQRMKHLSRYEYFGLGTFAPRVFPQALEEMIDFDKSLGFEGSYVEVYTFLPQTAPMVWAFAQKQWDPKLKMDNLLHEFYTKMYGPAAPTMQKYFALMENSWNTPRPEHMEGWVNADIVRQAASISPEALEQGMQLLNQALAQATTPIIKKRIEVTQGGLQYAGYAIQEFSLAQQLAAMHIDNSTKAQQAFNEFKELGKVLKGREIFWPQAKKRSDLLGQTLHGLERIKNGYLRTNTAPLGAPAVPALIQLMNWYQQNQPQQAQQVYEQLRAAFPAATVFDAAFDWSWISQNHPKSLVKNGNFEATGESNVKEEAPDWNTKDAPAGWASWSRYKEGKFTSVAGRDGVGSAWQIDANIHLHKASLVQNIPVQTGQKYLGVAWVKIDHPETGIISFTLRYRTADAWYTGPNKLVTVNAAKTKDWQRLLIPVTIPETVAKVAVTLEATGGTGIFDDVALYRISP